MCKHLETQSLTLQQTLSKGLHLAAIQCCCMLLHSPAKGCSRSLLIGTGRGSACNSVAASMHENCDHPTFSLAAGRRLGCRTQSHFGGTTPSNETPLQPPGAHQKTRWVSVVLPGTLQKGMYNNSQNLRTRRKGSLVLRETAFYLITRS